MKIAKYIGKHISITFNDGMVLNGRVINYTVAGDNDPEEESIEFIPESGVMKDQVAEVMEHEVKSVKVLD